ncbi:kunitz-type protease inhibitor 2 [Sceloporus undulatus]|uniref:kunitz-type protease inhibitor 2 n=1 Tax=Sceloporus undulatus TaxID=8520 RepID=UPI001C4CC2D1|nr:kunitz-type protease inhibitor 2 [Sceloporus undulatus]
MEQSKEGTHAALAGALLLLLLCSGAESRPDSCQLPKVVGRCRAAFQRWWYNATSQTCQKFIFGGCRGNPNNFLSEQDCLQECATGGEVEAPVTPGWPTEETMSTTKATSRSGHRYEPGDDRVGFKEYCAAPRTVGPCRAAFPRWYFDIETQACKAFIYGGCGGNKNNYISEDHCLSQCNGKGEITDESPDAPTNHVNLIDPLIHSTRAVILLVVLAIMSAILLGSMVVFFVKICRRSQELSLGTVWSTLDDKEYLMSNAYTL